MGKYTLSLLHTPTLVKGKLGIETIMNVEQVSSIYQITRDGYVHQCFDIVVRGFPTKILSELLQRRQMFNCDIASGDKRLPGYEYKSVYLLQLDSTTNNELGFSKEVATFSVKSTRKTDLISKYLKGMS